MGGKNNFFNQVGTKLAVTAGLMDDPNSRVDKNLAAQAGAIQSLVAQTARGQGPSIAQMQYDQMIDQAAQQQMQAAASARGVNPALAHRASAQAVEQAAAQAARQSALIGEEERRRAQELLLMQYSGQRGQQLTADEAGRGRMAQLISGVGQAMATGGKGGAGGGA
jgi:hypothetical protein